MPMVELARVEITSRCLQIAVSACVRPSIWPADDPGVTVSRPVLAYRGYVQIATVKSVTIASRAAHTMRFGYGMPPPAVSTLLFCRAR